MELRQHAPTPHEHVLMSARWPRPQDRDPLDRACDRIWFEIRELLPRHRVLFELGEARTVDQARELKEVSRRVGELRRRVRRYRDVLRDEAWGRHFEEEPV